jgi:RNA polymerase sigma-70 factor (ECF subfamily)
MASFEGWSLALPLDQPLDQPYPQEARPGLRSVVVVADLVQTYSPLLFRVANSILRSPAEAEDVVQDVFVRVLERQRSERREALDSILDMRVWLIRIAWNLALTRRRRIRPDQMDDLFAQGLVSKSLPADQAVAEAQRMKAVLREMERLPKGEHHVLLLSAVEELGTAEIAAVLGKSESAVRALLFRARTRLRKRLIKEEVRDESSRQSA